jgi:hypothetical protein
MTIHMELDMQNPNTSAATKALLFKSRIGNTAESPLRLSYTAMKMKDTPKTTNKPMILPSPQGYTAPPHCKGSNKHTIQPTMARPPRISSWIIFSRVVLSGCSLGDS